MKVFCKILMTIPLIVLLQTDLSAAEDQVFGTVVAGSSGNWTFRTVFRISNQTDSEQEFRFQFQDSEGGAAKFPLAAFWSIEGRLDQTEGGWVLTLPAGSSVETVVVPEGAARTGWVRIENDEALPVQCFLQIGQGDPEDSDVRLFEDLLVREVEMSKSAGARDFTFPVTHINSTQDVSTAFALVNLSAQETEIELVFRPDTVKTVRLGAGAIMTAYFDEFWGLSFPEIFPFRLDGVAEIHAQAPLGMTIFRTLEGLPSSRVASRELPGATEPSEASLGEEIELAFGEAVHLEGTSVNLRFWNIKEDSRCPIGAVCVWEGRAVVEMRGTFEGQVRLFDLIAHAGNQELATVQIGGYTIELKAVEPIPDISQPPITLQDYRIRLLIKLNQD